VKELLVDPRVVQSDRLTTWYVRFFLIDSLTEIDHSRPKKQYEDIISSVYGPSCPVVSRVLEIRKILDRALL
jgi:hypothetical protein